MGSRSAKEVWEAALGELQVQVSRQNYLTWLGRTEGLSLENKQFVVGVPNTFVAEYLDKKQRSLIEKTLIGLTGSDVQVNFQVHNGRSASGRVRGEAGPALQNGTMFNPRYTFASFIAGDCNQLARRAALDIVEKPGQEYNPLFIYGGVGMGKTHLLHAIGQAALGRNLQVLYVSAERFTNDFVAALSERKAGAFHNKYRSVDMLLIDDIQFLTGKEQTEESFFHTFNELHNSGRQIIVTSDVAPKALTSLQKRLRSRLEGGLTVTIQPPDPETRLNILRAKAEQQGSQIPPESLLCIAERAERSIRELEGLLNRVIVYARLVQAPVTPQLVVKATEDIASTADQGLTVSPSLVIEAVARVLSLNPADLRCQKRARDITLARHLAMYLTRQETTSSLAEIGREFGGRDHSTVIHACEKITHELVDNAYLQRKAQEIHQEIKTRLNTQKS